MTEEPDYVLVVSPPPPNWEWDLIGGRVLVVTANMNPSWWRRVITRVVLGSVWKRL